MSVLGGDSERMAWWAVAAALAAVVAYVAYSFVGTLVLGLFIYYCTRPVYRRISARVGRPNVAAAIAIFALALPVLLIVGYTVVVAARELQELTAIPIPEVGTEIFDLVADPRSLLEEGVADYLTADLLREVIDALLSAADTFLFVAVGLIHLFVMVALAFYLLRDDQELAGWFRNHFDNDGGVLERYLTAVDRDLKSIFFGNILNAFITGAIGAIVFSMLNVAAPPRLEVPAAALLGLLAGVASLIPVVGMKLVYVPVAALLAARAALVVGLDTLWFVGLFLLVTFVIVDTIPDLILRPYVSGRSLHVGAVMLAYTLGPLMFGWYGLFLMPILLVVVVHFARIVLPELLSDGPIGSGLDADASETDVRTPEATDQEEQPPARDRPDPDATPSPPDSPVANSTEGSAERVDPVADDGSDESGTEDDEPRTGNEPRTGDDTPRTGDDRSGGSRSTRTGSGSTGGGNAADEPSRRDG